MSVDSTLERIVASLKQVKGIEAIVLGGSRAKGNFTEKSDLDIGIYYSDSKQLDLAELGRIASELDDANRPDLITDIGGWGPWINGGGWLTVDGIPTDFLLRDIGKVASVIEDCLNEKITIDYQPGHPHGFVNAIYAAETFYCKPLWDPYHRVQDMKGRITPYPAAIRIGIIKKFLWEADFSINIAEKSLSRHDVLYISGCLYRGASCLVQVIYALNETYLMNEKGALTGMDSFQIIPLRFKDTIERLLSTMTTDTMDMKEQIQQLSHIAKEVDELSKACI